MHLNLASSSVDASVGIVAPASAMKAAPVTLGLPTPTLVASLVF